MVWYGIGSKLLLSYYIHYNIILDADIQYGDLMIYIIHINILYVNNMVFELERYFSHFG